MRWKRFSLALSAAYLMGLLYLTLRVLYLQFTCGGILSPTPTPLEIVTAMKKYPACSAEIGRSHSTVKQRP